MPLDASVSVPEGMPEIVERLRPQFELYGVDPTYAVRFLNEPTVTSRQESTRALDSLCTSVSMKMWEDCLASMLSVKVGAQPWSGSDDADSLDLSALEEMRLLGDVEPTSDAQREGHRGPGANGTQSAKLFEGLEMRFRRMFETIPIDRPDDACELDVWAEQSVALCIEAGATLQSASLLLDPPFWPLREFDVGAPDTSGFSEFNTLESTAYWLLFVTHMNSEGGSFAWEPPMDEIAAGYADQLAGEVRALFARRLFDSDKDVPTLLAMCILACRGFSDWCRRGEPASGALPEISEATFSVQCGGKTCVLGNTQQFRLLQELVRLPRTYRPFADIAVAIGNHPDDSIHHVKSRLIACLNKSGLSSLSNAIRTETGHYGLFPE